MKRFHPCWFVMILFLLCPGCAQPVSGPAPDSKPVTLVWYLPSCANSADQALISGQINQIVQAAFPEIRLDFRFVNIYEYKEKVALYLASGEQMDIVWANDDTLPFINYPADNVYKFLDAPIKSNAPRLSKRLNSEEDALYRIFDKNYFIPMIEKNDGLIPFLKIPKELLQYMDISALLNAVSENDTASVPLFEAVNAYLDKLQQANKLGDGIDLSTLYSLFPQIGYETFISTQNLIGCKINAPACTAVDMLNTESTKLSYSQFQNWKNKGYIRDDIGITYKSCSIEAYRYILSGAWGYVDENGLSTLMDQHSENYVYIGLDHQYHTSELFSQSVALIPTSSKYPEKALAVLDLFYQDSRLYNLLTYGIENNHYTSADGIIQYEPEKSSVYRAFENIVPQGGGALKTIPPENIYLPAMEKGANFAGMFIPDASVSFRRTLFAYAEAFTLPVYETTLPDNSASDIGYLLSIYNSAINTK